MKLTRAEAVRQCKELWRRIKASGGSKVGYFATQEYGKWVLDCPLCDYAIKAFDYRLGNNGENAEPLDVFYCVICPLYQQYGVRCMELGFGYDECTDGWFEKVENLKEDNNDNQA